MLIDFCVENYRSFKNETIFSAETGERLTKYKQTHTIDKNGFSLLKNLNLFGPNGSGKSNMLEGLKIMRQMVLTDANRITDTLPYEPFLLAGNSRQKPQIFDVRFTFENQNYRYRFGFTANEIVFEELFELNGTKEHIYYQRHQQEFPVLPATLTDVAAKTKQNSLFLYNAQSANDAHAQAVTRWFAESLLFIDELQIPQEFLVILDNSEYKEILLNFLQLADFNIVDVKTHLVPRPDLPADLQRILALSNFDFAQLPSNQRELVTVHKVYDEEGRVTGTEEFQIGAESRGTQKILVIALAILYAQVNGNDKTVIMDEFDDSLHLELSKALLHVFNSEANENQFILTSHELQLMDAQLRVDQIYLFDKDFQGESSLISIFDFKDSRQSARRDINFMRRYMRGVFGAMPQISAEQMVTSLAKVGDQRDS